MEEERILQCETCIHKGICKNEERYKSGFDIWSRDETDEKNEIIYKVMVYCPNQLTYSEVALDLEMQRDFERRETERDDW